MKTIKDKQEAQKINGVAYVYAVVELEQECNKDKRLIDTVVFANREDALLYLHGRYDSERLNADSGSGEFASYFTKDEYSVVNCDGDVKEGYLSKALKVRGASKTGAPYENEVTNEN